MPEDDSEHYGHRSQATPAIPPKLRVDLNLGGRRVAQAIGDDWIINDGGETTIAVNGTSYCTTGRRASRGARLANGVWNVSDARGRRHRDGLRGPGSGELDHGDGDHGRRPAIIVDRKTLLEAEVRCPSGQIGFPNCRTPPPPPPPPPPMCPEGQIGTPPNCMSPPPPMCPLGQVGHPAELYRRQNLSSPCSMEEYAPRAALYEALPGFLLRLTGRGPAGAGSRPGNLAFPECARLVPGLGGRGQVRARAFDRRCMDYDFTRVQAELGVTLSSPAPWAEGLTGSLAMSAMPKGHDHGHIPHGRRRSLDAQGLGVAFGVAYQGVTAGAYFNGWGLVTHYDVDVASEAEGLLKRDAGVLAHAFGLETGHRVRLTAATHLTPRVWLVRSDLSMDRFTDAVNAQVALQAAEHLAGGVGMLVSTQYVWDADRTLALRGSVDVEQAFNDRETVVDVSGEALTSDSRNTRVLVGLGGAYHWGRFSVNGEVSVGGLDVSDQEIFGQLTLGVWF